MVDGSSTSQCRISCTCELNGSRWAVSGSGIRIMSDSLMPFQPVIEEPSNILPSSKVDSSMACAGNVTWWCLPSMSAKRKSTNSTSCSTIWSSTFWAVMVEPRRGMGGSGCAGQSKVDAKPCIPREFMGLAVRQTSPSARYTPYWCIYFPCCTNLARTTAVAPPARKPPSNRHAECVSCAAARPPWWRSHRTDECTRDRSQPRHPAGHHRGHHRVPADLLHRPPADRRALAGRTLGPVQRGHPGGRDPGDHAGVLEAHLAAADAVARSDHARLPGQADGGVPDHLRAGPGRHALRLQAARDGDADRLGAGDRRLLDDRCRGAGREAGGPHRGDLAGGDPGGHRADGGGRVPRHLALRRDDLHR